MNQDQIGPLGDQVLELILYNSDLRDQVLIFLVPLDQYNVILMIGEGRVLPNYIKTEKQLTCSDVMDRSDKIVSIDLNSSYLIHKNPTLQTFNLFRNLIFLDCSYSNTVKRISSLDCLKELYCVCCPSLVLIDLPRVGIVDCSYCETLITLSLGSSIIDLTCMDCPLIKLPDNMIQLTKLDCGSSNVCELPNDMIHLKELSCSFNSLIKRIPETLIHLETIDCNNCDSLKNIQFEFAPNLQWMECSYMNIDIPPIVYRNVLSLDIHMCSLIKEICVQPFNQLRDLRCHMCKNLEYIPSELTSLTRLDCSDCPLISSLPSTLIELERLDCYQSQLVSLPDTYIKLQYLACGSSHRLLEVPDTYTCLRRLSCSDCSSLRSIPKIKMIQEYEYYDDGCTLQNHNCISLPKTRTSTYLTCLL